MTRSGHGLLLSCLDASHDHDMVILETRVVSLGIRRGLVLDY